MADYRCVTNIAEIKKYLDGAREVAFDFECSPLEGYRNEEYAALDPHKADIVGISLSVRPDSGIYVPLKHRIGVNADFDEVMSYLKEALFLQDGITKIAHNLSFESMFLYKHSIIIQSPLYDTIAAAQLTLKSDKEFRNLSDSGLKTLVPELLKIELPKFLDVTGGRHFDELDSQDAETIRYACADSDFTFQLYNLFNGWFRKYLPKHEYVVRELESPTAVFVGMMKYNGIEADKALMYQKQIEAEDKLTELRNTINSIAGKEINLGANASTDDVKKFLYEDQGLPVLKTTTKYKEAADDEALILLKEYCSKNKPHLVKLIEAVQEYRKWSKLKSTYIDGILSFINSVTGAVHADFFPLGTETGRFASRRPNLQNCFDDQTEILTLRGFIKFSELTEQDKVAQWENGKIEFVTPLQTIKQNYKGNLVYLSNIHIDLALTPDHRCLLQRRRTGQYFVTSALDYTEDCKQLHAGNYCFGAKELTKTQIILLAATQADGSYHDGGIDFTFSKARKYKRLLNTLREANIPFSEGDKASGQVRVRLLKSDMTAWLINMLGQKKCWGKWLLDYNIKTINEITNEIMLWDGCFTRSNHYSSSIKTNADWMQILYVLTNKRAHLREYQNALENAAVNYQVDVTDQNYSMTTNVKKELKPYDGEVYCVSVPSEFIVVRRNGEVCVTGNCPRKDSDPIGIRNFFVAREGHVFLDFDFSQIELRVGAYYCKDEKMLETYRSGGDIHAQTTSVIYGIPFEQAINKEALHYKERRTIAKNCNFGVFFGLFPKGLQKTLHFKAGLV